MTMQSTTIENAHWSTVPGAHIPRLETAKGQKGTRLAPSTRAKSLVGAMTVSAALWVGVAYAVKSIL
ncbi:hypothetical protein BJF92_05715 [Rhizobium rhizosphaerae]|uniref:Uncharacterized protein n=1 Tax=Xaviernesmea rhizosphaerae TaxID=1672749 RepID=A0A1Q9AFB5_9HYPH|nr:hypothetical protein [Xaviernesmea rhizosphaerae]OLP53647.1 hypothetical protein BJF92_05715 [Xaviernesmea rhizosphaerae]OQP85283.1 hypothetical protein BTR14_16770 [Xaviernesmea rhizosphaerae]